MRILIAEDDVTSRNVLTALLKKKGHEVLETVDGLAAWEALQQADAPRLAILDWMMPRLDGLGVVGRVRASLTERPPYLIMLTTKGEKADIIAGLDAGADDYLTKPCDPEELRAKVDVGCRIVEMQDLLAEHAQKMEVLAESRARQLIHADRMATLGTLAAGIAHEINNPATFIAGNAQTMQRAWEIVTSRIASAGIETKEDAPLAFVLEEVPQMLSGIRRGVERISNIVGGLKSYARQEEGKKKPFPICDVVAAALELCHNALKYQVSVELSLPDDLPLALCDHRQIEQVLINLITNAADAMSHKEDGCLWIDVRVAQPSGSDQGQLGGSRRRRRYERQESGPMLRVEVSDNGTGFRPDVLDKIFDPFFTTKKEGEGTGLGLSISKGIMEEHGGELFAGNRPEGGAYFVFLLPIVTAHSAPEENA